jgi:hypothetical protein
MRPVLIAPPPMAQPGYRPITITPSMPAPGYRPVTSPPRMQPIAIRPPRFGGTRQMRAARQFAGTRDMRAARMFAGLGDVGSSQAPISDTGIRGFLKWAQREYPPQIYQQIANGIQQNIPQAFSGYMLGGWRKFARLNGLADGTTGTVDTADAANSTASDINWGTTISQIIGTATGAYLDVAQQQNQNAIVQTQLQQAQAGKAPLNVSLGSSGISFGSTTGLSLGGLLLIGGLGFLALKAAKVI